MPSNAWVRFRSVAYLRGKGLHVGVINDTVLPAQAKIPGVFCMGVSPARESRCEACDDNLGVYANSSLDFVFVGRIIEAMPNPYALLAECAAKLKEGGHLLLHLPIGNKAEGPVRHTFYPDSVAKVVASLAKWRYKASYERNGEMLIILKKLPGRPGRIEAQAPRPPKTACIARYGAIGDLVIITPLIKRLKEDGYHVTVNTNPYSSVVLQCNPYIDNLVVQERDAIPNPQLGEYWEEWKGDYDRYVNLSESIEGSLLVVEGRKEFYTTKAYRQARGEKNYFEETLRIGGYPDEVTPRGELFFNPSEEKQGRDMRKHYKGKMLVAWLPKGSSEHKGYPFMPIVLGEWLDRHKDVLVLSIGGADAVPWEFDHPQVVRTAAQWPIRTSMMAIKYSDLVVGPETGMMNVAACYDMQKIVFLSHSTHEALCKHWGPSHKCIAPTSPCYPCFQLHFTQQSCPHLRATDAETGQEIAHRPACTMEKGFAEKALATLEDAYEAWRHGTIEVGATKNASASSLSVV